jgi:EAL domain-containing protein (putative c-di-GMP-specific phosphodiesterase class I)/GGDEF domain-containing protein
LVIALAHAAGQSPRDILTPSRPLRDTWHSSLEQQRFINLVRRSCKEGRHALGIFVIDLPGVLEIAETYGDAARQTLLQRAHTRLCQLFGTEAVGSDPQLRFILLVKGITAQDASGVAERIQDALRFRRDDIDVVMVGAPTIGAAMQVHSRTPGATPPTPSDEADDLIRRAQLALHQAARDRPGSFRLYNTAFDTELRRTTVLRQALRKACDENAFRIEYQPIVDLRHSQTIGLEALIRWDAPASGSDSPAHFIAVAEETGLIVPIGAQVLNEAMQQAQTWAKQGQTPPRISVNVSSHQLRDAGFQETVVSAVTDAGLTPAALELELTERTLIDSTPGTIRMLEHLRQMGVAISVDDFGTGYSSLRYLQELPISKFKIDRIFISRLEDGARERALVDAMIRLATSFDLTVVAEGIETTTQLAILRRQDCYAGQGFLFSPPARPVDVTASFQKTWTTR